jgi:hypothetical protein
MTDLARRPRPAPTYVACLVLDLAYLTAVILVRRNENVGMIDNGLRLL